MDQSLNRKLTNVKMFLVIKDMVHLNFNHEPDAALIKAAPLKPKTSLDAMYTFNSVILEQEMVPAEQHRLLRLKFIEPTSSEIISQEVYDALVERLAEKYPVELESLMSGEEIVPTSVTSNKTAQELFSELMRLYPEQAAEVIKNLQSTQSTDS